MSSVRTQVLDILNDVDITQWTRLQGIHPQTAYWWFRDRMLLVPAVRVNPRPVPASQAAFWHTPGEPQS